MIKSRIIYYAIILNLLVGICVLKAQIQHPVLTIPPGQLSVNQLFAGTYINTTANTLRVKVRADLFIEGEKVLSMLSKEFSLSPSQVINLSPYNIESTMQPYKVNYVNSDIQQYAYGNYNNIIPLNKYEYCISILDAIEEYDLSPASCTLSDNTFQNCPHPISPFSGNIEDVKPIFSWTPTPQFNVNSDCYLFRMVKMTSGQNQESALMNNVPLVEQSNLKTTTYMLPLEITLDSCEQYAWQIEYLQNCNNVNTGIQVCGSESSKFSMKCNDKELKDEEEQLFVFHPLKKELSQGLYVVKDDTLRMQIVNYYNTVDSVPVQVITEKNEKVQIDESIANMFELNKGLQYGQNLLKLPLGITDLKKNKNYIIKLTAIDGGIYQLRFHYQENK